MTAYGPTSDEIACEAARLLSAGELDDIAGATRQAAVRLGAAGRADLPSAGRVREHLRAAAMAALGEAGYRATVVRVWTYAEELMSLLEETLPDTETLLVGRAARGQIDGGVTLHVRVYTDSPIGEIAQALVEHEIEEPRFETAETTFGRLDRLRFEDEGLPVVVTRCPPGAVRGPRDRSLFDGTSVHAATTAELRTLVAERG